MQRLRRALLGVALLALLLPLGPAPAVADVDPTGPVSASASGAVAPTTATEPATVTNGDFTITGDVTGSTVGDGDAETTTWSLDFTTDPDVVSLPDSGTLLVADLELTLTPGSGDATDDTIQVGSLAAVAPTEFANLQSGSTDTVTVDLLGYYSAHQLLDAVDDGGDVLALTYADDAIVSFAQLTLEAATETEFFASDAAAAEVFGRSIDIDGTTMVVGAPGAVNTGLPGKAYVFTFDGTTWNEEAILQAATPDPNSRFGFDVAIDGSTIAVGAYHDNGQGSVTIFSGSGATWTEEARLTGSTGAFNDQFGHTIDLDGNRLAVGAPLDSLTGAVFLFEDDGTSWTEQYRITTQQTSDPGLFGDALALDGDVLAVGAPIEDAGSVTFAGNVYIHDATTGAHQQTIAPTDRNPFQTFGNGLAFDNGTLVIGAPGDFGTSPTATPCFNSSSNCNPGSVYVYNDSASGFVFDTEVHPDDVDIDVESFPAPGFGVEIDLLGDTLIVGAPAADSAQVSQGKAYVFDRELGTWTPRVRLTLSDRRQGDSAANAVQVFDDDTFLVGVPLDDNANGLGSSNEGAFYQFIASATGPTCNGLPATIVGTNGDDVLEGTDGVDVIVALGGDDVIVAGPSADVICAGAGDDVVVANNGRDVVFGDEGDDVLIGNNGRDTVSGGADNDILVGWDGRDTLNGDEGDDRLHGGNGNDTLDGGAGTDECVGGPGSNTAANCE